jgi:hypothetical protein
VTGPFHEALRAELLAAARRDLEAVDGSTEPERRHRRRRDRRSGRRSGRRPVVVGLAAGLAAAIGVGALVLGQSTASADVEVRVRDSSVVVRVRGHDATAGEIEAAMVDAGLDVEVVGVPVGPSLVGELLNVALDQGGAADVVEEGADGYSFVGFSIPVGWPGTLRVNVGAAAPPGSPYAVSSDAFAEGEPLHCVAGRGRRLRDLAPELRSRPVEVAVHSIQGGPIDPLTAALAGPLADAVVTRADATSPTGVLLTVDPAATPTAPPAAPC